MDYILLIRNGSIISILFIGGISFRFAELRIEFLKDNMEIHQAIELVALLYFDGKIDEGK